MPVEFILNEQYLPITPPGEESLAIVHRFRSESHLEQAGQVFLLNAQVCPEIVIVPPFH